MVLRFEVSVPHDLAGIERYGRLMVAGIIKPTWPNGGWSITVEMHFYLLLWIILPLQRRWPPALLLLLGVGLGTRFLLYEHGRDVAYFAYFTIVGRVDQFVMGIAAWEFRGLVKGRHWWVGTAAVAFFAFYQWFLGQGGYYGTQGTRLVWVFLPTIEAVFFSLVVGYYDNTFNFRRAWPSRLLEAAGAASYSLYLLHPFVVFYLAGIAGETVPRIAVWEIAEAVAVLAFVLVVPFAWLCYRYVEITHPAASCPLRRGSRTPPAGDSVPRSRPRDTNCRCRWDDSHGGNVCE